MSTQDTSNGASNGANDYLELLKHAVMGTLCTADERTRSMMLEGWPVAFRDVPWAFTLVGKRRLESLEEQIATILRDDVHGDLIETGVWRGGACIFMRGVLRVLGESKRKVVVADSFQGLPRPDVATYPTDEGDTHYLRPELCVDQKAVVRNFNRFGLLDDRVEFVPGWFRDTLPGLSGRQWSLVRLDGDMYESTILGLRHLYPGLSPGGFLIADDYGDPGKVLQAKKAVDDYRAEQGITEDMAWIDGRAIAWRKAA